MSRSPALDPAARYREALEAIAAGCSGVRRCHAGLHDIARRALTGTPTPAALCLELLNAGRCCNLECHHDGECDFTAATPEPTPMAVPLRPAREVAHEAASRFCALDSGRHTNTCNIASAAIERDRASRPPGAPALRRRMPRKHGSQLVDEENWNNEEMMESARAAMDTPLVRGCYKALEVVAEKHGLVACDPDGGECQFPRCLVAGCEAEPGGTPTPPGGAK